VSAALLPAKKLIRDNQEKGRGMVRLCATVWVGDPMKICPNPKCAVFGRIVYTLATRCPLCKWDLKIPLPSSEVEKTAAQASSR